MSLIIDKSVIKMSVSPALRLAFKVHCLVDLSFAIPLLVYPNFMSIFGFQSIDPFSSRLFAAALFAIGLSSWSTDDMSREVFRKMLRLKILFSAFSLLGVFVAIGTTSADETVPWGAWFLIVPTFSAFHLAWQYFYFSLKK